MSSILKTTMAVIIKFLGILFILLGVSFLIDPQGVYRWVEDNSGNQGFYISVVIGRLVFGTLLLFAAKVSKYPRAIYFIGSIMIIAAIIIMLPIK